MKQASAQRLERFGYSTFGGLDVLWETVDDASGRRGLEELHGGAQNRVKHVVVEKFAGEVVHHQVDEVRGKCEQALEDSEDHINREEKVLFLFSIHLVAVLFSPDAKPVVRADRSQIGQKEESNENGNNSNATSFEIFNQNREFNLFWIK